MSAAKGGDGGVKNDLSMSPEQMLELARQTAELVVRRIENLPGEGAWEGEFRRELEDLGCLSLHPRRAVRPRK